MPKRKPVDPEHYFHCEECDLKLNLDQLLPHVQEVHGINETRAVLHLTFHMDSSDHYTTNHELIIGGLKLTETIVQQREWGFHPPHVKRIHP